MAHAESEAGPTGLSETSRLGSCRSTPKQTNAGGSRTGVLDRGTDKGANERESFPRSYQIRSPGTLRARAAQLSTSAVRRQCTRSEGCDSHAVPGWETSEGYLNVHSNHAACVSRHVLQAAFLSASGDHSTIRQQRFKGESSWIS